MPRGALVQDTSRFHHQQPTLVFAGVTVLALALPLADPTVSFAQPTPTSTPAGDAAHPPAGSAASQPASAPTSAPTTAPATRRAKPERDSDRATSTGRATGGAPEPSGGGTTRSKNPYRDLDQTGTPTKPPRKNRLPPQSAAPGKKRPTPDYDGRPPLEVSAREVLIWFPRVLFYPIHLVLDWGLRRPLVKGVTLAEKYHLFSRIERFFTLFDGRAMLFPTFLFDFGFNPSIGLRFSGQRLLHPNNRLTAQVGVWFTGWLHALVEDRFNVFRDDAGVVTLRAEFTSRPDKVFAGIGPEPRGGRRRYRNRLTEAAVSLRSSLGGLNRLDTALLYRNNHISGGQNPSVDDSASPYLPDLAKNAPGFGSSYHLLTGQVRLELDSRDPDRMFTPGSGVRLELFGRASFDPSDVQLSFLRYGARAGGFWDFTGLNHVLSLLAHVELLEPLGDGVIPFTELIELGGNELLQGYLRGRWRGESAMVVTLAYQYPVWSFLDAYLMVATGNAFRGRFEQLHIKRLLLSWGAGFRSNMSRDVAFQFLLAFGTNQYERWSGNFQLENIRVVLSLQGL